MSYEPVVGMRIMVTGLVSDLGSSSLSGILGEYPRRGTIVIYNGIAIKESLTFRPDGMRGSSDNGFSLEIFEWEPEPITIEEHPL